MSNPQLLWNFRVNPEEENARYVFAIVNDSREIEAIKSRLMEAFSPVDTIGLVEKKGRVHQTDYYIIAFNSHKKLENPNKIYRGKIRKDPRLYEREKTGMEGLEAYVTSLLNQ